MKCIKCEKEIEDGFKVCPYCGTRVIEDGVLCKFCEEINEKDNVYCSRCGKRVDGKLTCNNCKNIVEPDYSFCPNCASPITKEKNRKKQFVIEKFNDIKNNINKQEKYKKTSFYKYISLTLISFFLMVLAFCNIFSLKVDIGTIFGDNKSKVVEVNYSTFDALSALFCDKNYSMKDFEFEYRDDLEDINIDVGDIDTVSDVAYVLEEVVEETNPFKFIIAATNESEGIEGSVTAINFYTKQAARNSIIGMILIIVNLGIFVISSIKLYLYITKDKEMKFNFPILEIVIMCLCLINKKISVDLIYNFGNSAFFTSCAIFAVIYTLTNFGFDLVEQIINKTFDKKKFIIIPKIVLCTIALILCFSTTMSLVYSGETRYQKVSYTNSDFNTYFSAINQDEEFREKIRSYEYDKAIKEAVDEQYPNEIMKIYLNPISAIKNIKNVDSNIDLVFILSMISETLLIIAIVYYVFSLLGENREKHRYISILLCFTLSLTTMLCIIMSKYNLLNYFEESGISSVYKVSIGAGCIFAFIFLSGCLTLEILEKEKKILSK